MRIHKNNQLAQSSSYASILNAYNELFRTNGKVNGKEFWRETIIPILPNYSYDAWKNFLKRFKTEAGLAAASVVYVQNQVPSVMAPDMERKVLANLKSADLATREGIARALNIGYEALQEIIENPNLSNPLDRADLLFKAMKAQDSRVIAAAKVNKERRETQKFNRMFDAASYSDAD
mgnify:CR=1 FL=1